ncbi:hypothetical protein DFH11DRAFT_122813 [Phellopilus nigrolimitatus]|nr:hypothetical protein DFH11DRAFT_122813 [Phellopilus nigrolimitatus]
MSEMREKEEAMSTDPAAISTAKSPDAAVIAGVVAGFTSAALLVLIFYVLWRTRKRIYTTTQTGGNTPVREDAFPVSAPESKSTEDPNMDSDGSRQSSMSPVHDVSGLRPYFQQERVISTSTESADVTVSSMPSATESSETNVRRDGAEASVGVPVLGEDPDYFNGVDMALKPASRTWQARSTGEYDSRLKEVPEVSQAGVTSELNGG